MTARDLLLPPNLLSLARILFTPAIGYCLWRGDSTATAAAVLLLVLAGITDGLDGYLARRLHQTSQIGLILDPLADKVFAATLVIQLVLFRDLPIWLAGMILGRDVLILLAGMLLLGERRVAPASNLTGQYTFFAIILLIGFSVIRFTFGVKLLTILVPLLLAASTFAYGRAFLAIYRGQPAPAFRDRAIFKAARIGLTTLVLAVCLLKFILRLLG